MIRGVVLAGAILGAVGALTGSVFWGAIFGGVVAALITTLADPSLGVVARAFRSAQLKTKRTETIFSINNYQ